MVGRPENAHPIPFAQQVVQHDRSGEESNREGVVSILSVVWKQIS